MDLNKNYQQSSANYQVQLEIFNLKVSQLSEQNADKRLLKIKEYAVPLSEALENNKKDFNELAKNCNIPYRNLM